MKSQTYIQRMDQKKIDNKFDQYRAYLMEPYQE